MLTESTKRQVLHMLEELPGEIGFYYRDLQSGEELEYDPQRPVVAASVIKLAVLVRAFEAAGAGELSLEEIYVLKDKDKLPSCGALKAMHDGLEVTLRDLCHLMITLSDNTATNILIRRLGMEKINAAMRRYGLEKTTLRRLLFDSEASARGLENTITAGEMGKLLQGMYNGEVVSEKASREMLDILKDQRLNGKMPFWLAGVPCAHKTGEDDGISHDVGIVYTRQPFIVCFVGQKTDPARFIRVMQDATRLLAGR